MKMNITQVETSLVITIMLRLKDCSVEAGKLLRTIKSNKVLSIKGIKVLSTL